MDIDDDDDDDNDDDDDDDEEEEEHDVSLGDTEVNYNFDNDGKSKSSHNSSKSNKTMKSTKQESVTMSVDENNHLLLKNRKSNNSNKQHSDNMIIRELKKHIETITPHWFFELCPVTRIGLEKVCIVIGNLNVEKYLVGSFKESEMLFYTEKNDLESTIHPYKYSLIGKMWDSYVRFTRNEDFRYDLQNLFTPYGKSGIGGQNRTGTNHAKSRENKNKIAEADYITDSIYLFDKLLPNSMLNRDDIIHFW